MKHLSKPNNNLFRSPATSIYLLFLGFTSIKVCINQMRSFDWKTFNNATFSADYKSKDWPTFMQIDKRILIFLFTIILKMLKR